MDDHDSSNSSSVPCTNSNEAIKECQALAAELEDIFGEQWEKGTRPADLSELYEHIHSMPEEHRPLGLAFSGGGVRSSTFNLGVLQGLAQIGWLPKFNFLSTVSGGGYIGSWLSAWIKRAGFEKVNEELRRTTFPKNESGGKSKGIEPDPIRHLRGYSNYLSPEWGLSLDSMTLIATYIRNLFINWLVFLPLLAAIVLFPKVNLEVIKYALSTTAVGGMPLLVLLLFVVATGLVVAIAYTASDIPGAEGHRPTENAFYRWCVIPLMIAAMSASWLWPRAGKEFGELDGSVEKNMWWIFAVCGAAIYIVGLGIGLLWRGRRVDKQAQARTPQTQEEKEEQEEKRIMLKKKLWDALMFALAGGVAGIVCYFGVAKVATIGWLLCGSMRDEGYAALAVPFLLSTFALSTTCYAALTRQTRTEADREWWARAGGFLLIIAMLWLGLHAVGLYIPTWVHNFIDAHSFTVPAAGIGVGVIGVVIGYWTKNGSRITNQAIHWARKFGLRMLDVICVTFIVIPFSGMSVLMDRVLGASRLGEVANVGMPQILEVIRASAPLLTLAWLALFVFISLAVAYTIGVNAFSMHAMYGNRLVRAYLGASNVDRNPHAFTGFDTSDNIKMADLPRSRNLFHIVNSAVNIVQPSPDKLEWQERKAAVFTVTRLHSGSPSLGYRSSKDYGDGISLARAMTISGAAASPNMGYHTSSLVAFVMTFFNVRLGWWLPNPKKTEPVDNWKQEEPRFGFGSLLREALSGATIDKDFIYLSDGGHFENLALYELVRRRCHGIVVVDAGADPEYGFGDLQGALRKIRVDLGVSIEFDWDSLPTPDRAKERKCHFSIGKIRYSAVDAKGVDGYVIYVKPVLSGDECLDVEGYARTHSRDKKQFPHQPTSDQFFDESQFESYRWLGYHSIVGGDFPSSATSWRL